MAKSKKKVSKPAAVSASVDAPLTDATKKKTKKADESKADAIEEQTEKTAEPGGEGKRGAKKNNSVKVEADTDSAYTAEPAAADKEEESRDAEAQGASRKVKKTKKSVGGGELFASVPDADEIAELAPIDQIDESELERIEAEAIAALPHTEVEPELLSYDSYEIEDTHESAEEAARYEAFLSDYKDVMSKMLSAAKDGGREGDRDESELGDISDFIIDDADFDSEDEDEEEYLTAEELEATGLGAAVAAVSAELPSPDEEADGAVDDTAEDENSATEDGTAEEDDAEDAADDIAADIENYVIANDNAEEHEDEAAEAQSADTDTEALEATDAEDEKSADEVKAEITDSLTDGDALARTDAEVAEEADAQADAKGDSAAAEEKESRASDEAHDEHSGSIAEETVTSEASAEAGDEHNGDIADEPAESESVPDSIVAHNVAPKLKVSGRDDFPDISLLEYLPRSEEDEADGEPNEELAEDYTEEEELTPDEEDGYGDGGIQLEMDFGDEAPAAEEPRESEGKRRGYDPEHPRFIDTVFDILELFVATLAIVIVATTFFIRHSIIDGPSMMNTLDHRDIVIISSFLYTPERGDIVVFEDKSLHPTPLIKRVIGIEGDTVEITRDGRVILNGELLTEEYVYKDTGYIPDAGVWKIGKGEIFVLGDHRNVSNDSGEFGPVSADTVLGRVLFRLYPFEKFGGVD